MNQETVAASAPPIRPLGLPPGSVRALVALTVVGVYVNQTLAGEAAGLLLTEALLIVLAHYFASRRVVAMPPGGERKLRELGFIDIPANPLWLPRNSVRLLILLAFGFTFGILLLRGQLFAAETADNLFLVFTYLAGVLVHQWRARRGERAPGRFGRIWVHLKALFVVLACAAILLLSLGGALQTIPVWLEKLLLGWILFYFGSR